MTPVHVATKTHFEYINEEEKYTLGRIRSYPKILRKPKEIELIPIPKKFLKKKIVFHPKLKPK